MEATNKYEAVQMAIHAFANISIPEDRHLIQVPIIKNIGYGFSEKITEEDMKPRSSPYFIVIFERRNFDDITECEPKGWKVKNVEWT